MQPQWSGHLLGISPWPVRVGNLQGRGSLRPDITVTSDWALKKQLSVYLPICLSTYLPTYLPIQPTGQALTRPSRAKFGITVFNPGYVWTVEHYTFSACLCVYISSFFFFIILFSSLLVRPCCRIYLIKLLGPSE